MRLTILTFLLVCAFASPVLAGNLTITAFGNVSALSTYVNTKTNQTIFNLTVAADTDDITINGLNISFTGTASVGNISNVTVYNSSTSGLLLGHNSTFNSTPVFVNFSATGSSLVVKAGETRYLVVRYEIKSSATRYNTTGGNITGRGDIVANNTVVSNITLSSSTSTPSQIQDLHANANVTPRFVDTNVINQSFAYTITATGADGIKNITINLPSGYPLVNITALERGGVNLTPNTDYTNVTLSNQINITLSNPTTQNLKVFFTANTSSSSVASTAFTATLDGGNLSSVSTDVISNQTNVTTKVLANVTDIVASKTVAIANGTDYWEFNFTINFTETVSGLLQFKMTNWNNIGGSSIPLVSGSTNLTTLRNNTVFETINKTNIRNDYNISDGLSYSGASGFVIVYLRQIIPAGTAISQTWFTTYSFIFRAI